MHWWAIFFNYNSAQKRDKACSKYILIIIKYHALLNKHYYLLLHAILYNSLEFCRLTFCTYINFSINTTKITKLYKDVENLYCHHIQKHLDAPTFVAVSTVRHLQPLMYSATETNLDVLCIYFWVWQQDKFPTLQFGDFCSHCLSLSGWLITDKF